MRPTLENFIAIAVLLATGAWLLHGVYEGKPEFEPVIAFAVALGAIFVKEPVKRRFGWGAEAFNHDRILFARFQKVLPADPTIRFLKEHDFGASFARSRLGPLNEFVETWDSVDTEFLDKRVQAKKEKLYGLAKDLASEVAARTSPIRQEGYSSVYPDSMRALGQGRPPQVIEDARILNQLARQFAPEYEEFVRYCKIHLSE